MSVAQSTKRCSRCQTTKPVSEFFARRRSADGLQSFCKACNRALALAWNKAHPEQRVVWRRANLVRERMACAEWRRKHPAEVKRYLATYARKNPAKMRQKCARRRALLRGSTPEESKAVSAFYTMVATADRIACRWCGESVPKGRRQVDHVIPLARGGRHAVPNLCCACARCNNRKHAKLPAEFTGRN